MNWRLKVILWLWPKGGSSGACANRWGRRVMFGLHEVTLTVRDPTQDDGYSREELMRFLKIVRESEQEQGWKVPEPD
jgi:hypothetical protein